MKSLTTFRDVRGTWAVTIVVMLLFGGILMGFLTPDRMVRGQEATPTPNPDTITQSTIGYGQVVDETLTERSFVDLWRFYGSKGDHIIARMSARDGLAPLLGITDVGGNLLVRSDVIAGGVQFDAAVDGIAEIDFVLPDTGEYTLVATRAGNETGTTTGSYSLSLTYVEREVPELFREVVFRCGSAEIVTAASLEIIGEQNDSDYRITVYGLDGFDPYIRVDVVEADETQHCVNEPGDTTGQQIMLSDDGELTVDQETVRAAHLSLGRISHLGLVRVIIGSRDGAAGRFYAVIEGAEIQPAGNFDRVNILTAGRARTEPLWLYMLRHQHTRIDPQISFVLEDSEDFTLCDDAGRFECAQVPSAVGYRFPLADGTFVAGDAFSAGVMIESPDLLYAYAQLRSRTAATRGPYTMLLAGVLPSLTLDEARDQE